ncbi:MAG: transglycosylase SLT domain-containing protein [Chromatiaceae bacterium]|nr:transglycosylase SLT domain-containing protein [Gammaproteobacteria bacterium]MCP5300401.1 transglycosylase SLT domain-containing protein [Chromatiaceae bacterium]MCP5422473.1 transglycosylase SLT domain-containing protein [Chromatiaceae bacterium]
MTWRGTGWLLAALLPALAIAGIDANVRHERWTGEFDYLFRKYTKHYFGAHFDWHWFKAQAIAESALNPDAKSPMGATGLMQVLPGTYKEIKEQIPYIANIEDPRWNVAAGIYYDRQLYRKWKQKHDIGTNERLNFAFASYNAGYGNVLKAYKRAVGQHGDARAWQRVAPFAPTETRLYVSRIQQLMEDVD